MNESPALSRAFFCSTSCWRLEGLCVAPGAEDMLDVPLRGRFSEGSETSDFLEARRLLCALISKGVGPRSQEARMSQAAIAAISGLIPTMFMTRVRL